MLNFISCRLLSPVGKPGSSGRSIDNADAAVHYVLLHPDDSRFRHIHNSKVASAAVTVSFSASGPAAMHFSWRHTRNASPQTVRPSWFLRRTEMNRTLIIPLKTCSECMLGASSAEPMRRGESSWNEEGKAWIWKRKLLFPS
jgi:hypothetical protein